jgi:hypothetical protein
VRERERERERERDFRENKRRQLCRERRERLSEVWWRLNSLSGAKVR